MYPGNLMMVAMTVFAEATFNIVGFTLEDLIYGDLRYITSTILTAFYLPYSLSTGVLLYKGGVTLRMPYSWQNALGGAGHIVGYKPVRQGQLWVNTIFACSFFFSLLRMSTRINNWSDKEAAMKVKKNQ